MSNNSNNKKLIAVCAVIIIAAIAVFACVLIFWQKGDNEPQKTTPEATTVTEIVTPAPTKEPEKFTEEPSTAVAQQETTEEPAAQDFTGKWKPVRAVDIETGEDVRMSAAFGSGVNLETDGLNLKEDGTFTLWIGVGRDDGSHSGSYKVNENSIEASFDNGTTQTLTVEQGEDGENLMIKCKVRTCYVYFQKR